MHPQQRKARRSRQARRQALFQHSLLEARSRLLAAFTVWTERRQGASSSHAPQATFFILAQQQVHSLLVGNRRILDIHWPLEDQSHYYDTGPAAFIGHLLTREGEGSLLTWLKAKGWANGLAAGEVRPSHLPSRQFRVMLEYRATLSLAFRPS